MSAPTGPEFEVRLETIDVLALLQDIGLVPGHATAFQSDSTVVIQWSGWGICHVEGVTIGRGPDPA